MVLKIYAFDTHKIAFTYGAKSLAF